MVIWILNSLAQGTAVAVEAHQIVTLYATTLAANLSATCAYLHDFQLPIDKHELP
jgi:hypothetical protein